MKEGIRKEYKKQYDASTKKIDIVDVPEFNFIMIDGIGNPEVEEFHLKSKQEKNLVYLISPLEGLWDTYDNSKFDVTRKKMIKFTLMMAQPKLLDPNTFEIIKQKAANKKDNPYIVDIYLKRMTEGHCVQMLHKGAYNTEINTTKNMRLEGFHHEIYLNDYEKTPSEKLKTIVRYAIEENGEGAF